MRSLMTALGAELAQLDERPAQIAAERERLANGIAAATQRHNAAGDALAAGETGLKHAEAASKEAESHEGQVRPVTAAAFAAVPADAEAVEPAEELARLPDDPGVDPDDEAEKSPRRFRLF